MVRPPLALALVLALASPAPAQDDDGADHHRILIELFTSQG